MKIYTRTGDDGSTGLLGPERVLKNAPRVEAFGTLDELNAALGAVRSRDAERWLETELVSLQSKLFNVGAEVATTDPRMLDKLDRITEEDIGSLERWIDRLDAELPPLRQFVLPAGSRLATELHRARTVCRRAERRLVALQQQDEIEPRLVRYLNRLADLLFVMARWCNQRAGVPDMEWRAGSR
ncbi:MAG: cob(I)yrinic acid a,c-diamide adenosyltransferase [Gaiellales bacterium]